MWTTWTPSITQIQDSGIKTMPRSNSTSYPSLFALLPHTFCIIVTGEKPFEYIGKAIISHNTSVCRVKQVGAKQKRGTKNMRSLKPKFQLLCAIVQLQWYFAEQQSHDWLQLTRSYALCNCPTDQLLQPIMVKLLAQQILQLQMNSTINQRSTDFLLLLLLSFLFFWQVYSSQT